jgi:hypothetical protein
VNHKLIEDGRLEIPAGCFDRAAAAYQQGGGSSPIIPRSEVDDRRTAIHEASHCVVGRALGQDVAGCTIIPGDGYGGLTWGPAHDRSLRTDNEVPDLCQAIGELMPRAGEPRVNAAEIYAHVHVRVVDLMAGTAGELLLHLECEPWTAHSDIRQARALASIICTGEGAIDAYLQFGAREAQALILQHRAAVLAMTEALIMERTLDSAMIDDVIASAPEFARRAAWRLVLESARVFATPESNQT